MVEKFATTSLLNLFYSIHDKKKEVWQAKRCFITVQVKVT